MISFSLQFPPKSCFLQRTKRADREPATGAVFARVSDHLSRGAVSVQSLKDKVVHRISEYGSLANDGVGVLGSALSLLKTALAIAMVSTSVFDHALVIVNVVAALRIVQGCLSLVTGSVALSEACRDWRHARDCQDSEGMVLARLKIVNALLSIADGLIWTTMGIVCLACPEAGIALTIVQFALFYGEVIVDSACSLALTGKTMLSLRDNFRSFRLDILESHLAADDKRAAALRYLDLIWEEKKALAGTREAKQAIARRMGLTEALYKKIRSGEKRDALLEIEKSFNERMAEQTAALALTICCLAVSIFTLQVDLPSLSPALQGLSFGLNPDIWGAVNHVLWVAVYAALIAEDSPLHAIQKLFVQCSNGLSALHGKRACAAH